MAQEQDKDFSHGVFTGDQNAWDQLPQEFKAHLMAAFAHKAGLGPHPDKHEGPKVHTPDPDDRYFDVSDET